MPEAKGVEPDLWLIALDPERKLFKDILERFGKMPGKAFGQRIGKGGEYDVVVKRHGNLLCVEAASRQQAGIYVGAMGNSNVHAVAALLYHGSIGPEPVRVFNPDLEVEVVSGGFHTFTNGTSSFVVSPTVAATQKAWRRIGIGLDPTETSVPVVAATDLPMAIALGLISPAQ
jgi:hypothetical protein